MVGVRVRKHIRKQSSLHVSGFSLWKVSARVRDTMSSPTRGRVRARVRDTMSSLRVRDTMSSP